MSANLAARSMFDYIARMNQQQEDQDESFVVVGDFTASSWESALDESAACKLITKSVHARKPYA